MDPLFFIFKKSSTKNSRTEKELKKKTKTCENRNRCTPKTNKREKKSETRSLKQH